MKLIVSTPFAVAVEADNVRHVRAEDATGAFGILPGHADFLTSLSVSVIRWRDDRAYEHYIAVRGGVLEVRGGDAIAVATPETIADDDLHRLETEVIARFHRQLADEQAARIDAQRLYLAALHRIIRYVRGQDGPYPAGIASAGPGRDLAG
jgi:F-type H+-transporting ATPase subunit epsilon